MKKTLSLCVATSSMLALAFASSSYNKVEVQKYASSQVEQIKKVVLTDKVMQLVHNQNQVDAKLKYSERQQLNKQWRAERNEKNRPMINKLLHNELSKALDDIYAQHHDQFGGFFILGSKATLLGSTYITKNYWFGQRVLWRHLRKNDLYIGKDHINHLNKRHWTVVGVPIIENGKKIAVLGVRLYLPTQ